MIRWDPTAGAHAIVDLGSRNGSSVDGVALAQLPRFLADNAVIRVGDVLAIYEARSAPLLDPAEVDRDAIPGEAFAIQDVRAAVARAAVDHNAVLVSGETGVGKERIAGELHRLSRRAGPLIVANCSALSGSLIESQLFGHERGAFTGASARSPGLFRAAHRGTLFLDEIGELSLELQPKLLRAIEYGDIMPVGTTTSVSVDVRVVAATNRDLAEEVAGGRFRRDLYARLSLWEIRVPPLRLRRRDLLGWLARIAAQDGVGTHPGLSAAAAEVILGHRWDENLRGLHRLVLEMRSTTAPVSRAALPGWLAEPTSASTPAALEAISTAPMPAPTPVAAAPAGGGGQRPARPRPSREEFMQALIDHGWSIRATARHFERDRKQITRWIEFYAIVVPGRS
ncbi:MAG: sigma 54-interacting transcriptional regulator [Myxococcales bacterium]|nr:sigma 54-interacting transcriptional regulator [Myxococcales bacterium]